MRANRRALDCRFLRAARTSSQAQMRGTSSLASVVRRLVHASESRVRETIRLVIATGFVVAALATGTGVPFAPSTSRPLPISLAGSNTSWASQLIGQTINGVSCVDQYHCVGVEQSVSESATKIPTIVATTDAGVDWLNGLRIQPVDATASANACDGARPPRVRRGRPLSSLATALSCAWE